MMWGWGEGAGWMLPFMGVSAILWWVVAIAVVVALLRWVRTPGTARSGGDASSAAQEALDLRFARGEIDADEYEARRRLLAEG